MIRLANTRLALAGLVDQFRFAHAARALARRFGADWKIAQARQHGDQVVADGDFKA
jgi:hypothetical protein